MDRQEKLIATRDKLIQDNQDRNRRIDAWYELKDLKDPREGRKTAHGVTNRPKSDIQLAAHLIAGAPTRYRIPVSIQKKGQEVLASKAERALLGVSRVIDSDTWKAGGLPTWRMNAADILLTEGGLFVRSMVLNEGGSPVFIKDILCPKECYPKWGFISQYKKGLAVFFHHYKMMLEDAEWWAEELQLGSSWRDGLKDEEVTFTDCWSYENKEVVNAILINDALVRAPDYAAGTKSAFSEIPFLGSGVGYADRGRNVAILHQYESFLEPNRQSYKSHDDYLSYLMEKVRKSVFGMKLVRTDDGTIVLKIDDYMKQAGTEDEIIIPMKPGEDVVEVAQEGGILADANMIALFEAEVQRGGFAEILRGGLLGADLSGYAIQSLKEGAFANAGRFYRFLNLLEGEWAMHSLKSFADGSFKKPIKISGNFSETYNGFFYEEYTQKEAKDLDCMYVSCETQMSLPSNDIALLSAMRMAIPEPMQILSRKDAWEKYMPHVIQDPELAVKRIYEDMYEQHPISVAGKMARAAEEDAEELEKMGETERAAIARNMARMFMQQAMMMSTGGEQQGGRPGVRPEAGGLELETPSIPERRRMQGKEPTSPQRQRRTPAQRAGARRGLLGG